ncbi:MAG: GAF domain-containing protein [Blastocatellia bacterium]
MIGKLSVDNQITGRPLVVENLRIVSLFATWAAAAIESAKRSQTLEALSKITATFSASHNLEDILYKACQTAKELFDASHSTLVLFDENYEFGTVRTEYPPQIGAVGTKLPLRGVEVEESLVRQQKPIVLSDVAADLPTGELREILLGFDIRSLLVVPMMSGGRLLGSFSLDAIGYIKTFHGRRGPALPDAGDLRGAGARERQTH